MKRGSNHSHSLRLEAKFRCYPGEEQAIPLLRWLNDDATTEAAERVLGLSRDLEQLNSWTESTPAGRWSKLAETKRDSWNQRQIVLWRVVHTLARYKLTPGLEEGIDGFSISWSSDAEDENDGIWVFAEADAMMVAISLAKLRRIDRVRQCERPSCRKWFFAQLRTRRFCTTGSSGCQEKFYKSREGQDERKRRA
jgi:hypothetical protein